VAQYSFADYELSNKKTTRRSEFLNRMDKIIPWNKIIDLIKPFYYNNKTGRKATELETILRMYFLQNWFSLSDGAIEDEIYDSLAMKDFMKISASNYNVPDETVLCNFRHLLEENNIGKEIEKLINSLLEENGLIMHGGTIVDATIISAPKSTRNKDNSRDNEMHSTKKAGNWFFGAKLHIGVDSGTGYIHSHTITPANEHDITQVKNLIREDDRSVKGDSGYIGIEKRDEIKNDNHLSQIEFRAVRRPSGYRKKSNNSDIANRIHKFIEKNLISARQKVEYPFHIIKNIFKFRKFSYKGLAKNDNKLSVLVALTNIYMVSSANRSFSTY
jgi:transposase, IS5 family